MRIVSFNAIVRHLISLKILKIQKFLDLLAPESLPGLCLRSQTKKTITLQSLFSHMKLNLLPKNVHRLKCLDKFLLRHLNVGALEGLRNLLNLIYLKLLFIICYTALKPFSTQDNKKSSHWMNAIDNLSFYLNKIIRNQINIFSSAGPMSGCLSYYFLAELHTLIISKQNECGCTLKLVCDMTIPYSQMHCTDKYSQQSSIIWLVWLNGWVFI